MNLLKLHSSLLNKITTRSNSFLGIEISQIIIKKNQSFSSFNQDPTVTLKVLRDSNSRRESHPPPLDASVCRMSRRLQRQTRLMRPIKRNPSGRRFTISLREFKSAVPVRSFIYSVSSRTLFALTPRLASLIYEPAMINENAFQRVPSSIVHRWPTTILFLLLHGRRFFIARPISPRIRWSTIFSVDLISRFLYKTVREKTYNIYEPGGNRDS